MVKMLPCWSFLEVMISRLEPELTDLRLLLRDLLHSVLPSKSMRTPHVSKELLVIDRAKKVGRLGKSAPLATIRGLKLGDLT